MNLNRGGREAMRYIRIRFSTSKNFDFSELGIPLEVFRKKRALNYDSKGLRFNRAMFTMLKSSNAHMLIESTNLR